jgi:hypothetical protein
MGKSSEERVTVRYDDFDNPLEEVRSDVNREMRMDGLSNLNDRMTLLYGGRYHLGSTTGPESCTAQMEFHHGSTD